MFQDPALLRSLRPCPRRSKQHLEVLGQRPEGGLTVM